MATKAKQMNDVRPSFVRELYSTEARQILADFFIGLDWDEDEDEPMTKSDIIEATGVQRKAVMDHLEVLEQMGIVCSTEGKRWERYYPNSDADVIEILHIANDELYKQWEANSEDDNE